MNCPDCTAHFSDLRDICPRCHRDLRQHKIQLGLTPTYPNATYQDLLKKLGVHSTTHSDASPKPEAPVAQDAPAPAEPIAPSNSVTNLKFTSPYPDEPVSVFAEFSQDGLKPVERVPSDRLDYSISNESASIDSQVENSVPVSKELNQQFLDAWNEITLNQYDVATELNFEQLREVKNQEQIRLLFDMSYEAIINPDSEKQYAVHLETSEERKVKSEALEQQLHGIERLINAPLLTLKALKARADADRTKEMTEAPISVTPATRSRIAMAGLLDLALVIGLALLISAMYVGITDSDLIADTLDYREISPIRLIAPAVLCVSTMILCTWILPLFSLFAWGRSFGQKCSGIIILNRNGKKLRPSNIIVRSLSLPVSLSVFGFLPALWHRAMLHDRLAKTKAFMAN